MTRCAPIPHLALACLATLAACRAREPRSLDSTVALSAATPAATPAAGDSGRARDSATATSRDSARVAAAGAREAEDRPCLASRIGLPCAGSDGPP